MGASPLHHHHLAAALATLSVAAISTLCTEAYAQQDVNINVSATPKVVAPGQQVDYNVEIQVDGNYDIRIERDPRFGDFRLVGAGSAPSMVNRNGQIQRSLRVRYQLQAPQEHDIYTIEPPRVRVGTRSFTPTPVSVRVTDRDQIPEPTTPDGARNGVAFLDVSVEPADRDPYLGEQITLIYELYMGPRGRGLRAQPPTEPSLDDFWVEDLSDVVIRQRRTTTLQGQHWDVNGIRGYALFPLESGELTIEAMRIPLVRASLFGASSQFEASAEAVTLRVQELPPGAPAGFDRNNVGQWSMTSTLDSRSARVGGTLHYTLRITGAGRASRLKLPEFADTDAYRVIATEDKPEQIRQGTRIHGTRDVRYTLMPLKEGPLTLPELRLPYFNPDEGAYKVATVQERTIHVEPGELPDEVDGGEALAEVHRGESSGSNLQSLDLAEPLVPGELGPARAPTGTPWWLWLAPLLGLGVLGAEPPVRRTLARRLGPARARRALRQELDALLGQARAASGRERDEALLRALSTVLEGGLGLHTGALTVSEVRDALGSVERVEPALVDAVADLVSELTRGRYAPGAGSPQTLIERASQTLDALFEVSEPHRVQTSPGAFTALLIVGLALGLCTPLLSPSVAQAQPEATQEEAVRSWEANDFAEASRSWAQAAAEAADPALWFNAGTAALRAGDTGLARLYLERAALTHARHPDVAKNLQTAVNLVSLEDANAARFGAQSPVVARALQAGPWLGALALWLALLLAIARRFSGRPSASALRAACLAALVLTLLSAALHLGISQISGPERLGVVLEITELRVAPSEHAAAHLDHPELAAGAVVDLLRSREGWVEVTLPTGDVGWLPDSRVEAVELSTN